MLSIIPYFFLVLPTSTAFQLQHQLIPRRSRHVGRNTAPTARRFRNKPRSRRNSTLDDQVQDPVDPAVDSASSSMHGIENEQQQVEQRPQEPLDDRDWDSVRVTGALDKLPVEILEIVYKQADGWSRHVMIERHERKWSATGARRDAQIARDKLAKDAAHLFTENEVHKLHELAFEASWWGVNNCYKNVRSDDQKRNHDRCWELKYELYDSGRFTWDLVQNIQDLSWHMACYEGANKRDGSKNRKRAELAKRDYEHIHKQLQGAAVLRSWDFDHENAVGFAKDPKDVAHSEFDNREGQGEGALRVTGTYTKGETKSWSNSSGFTITSTTTVEAELKVPFIAGGKVEQSMSFEKSFEATQAVSFEKSTSITQEYATTVPPGQFYELKGIMERQEMNVPYTMVYDIVADPHRPYDGPKQTVTVTGVWRGVVVSRAKARVFDKLKKNQEITATVPVSVTDIKK